MKILDTSSARYPTPELGRICDRCGHRVQQHRHLSGNDERSAVAIGVEISRFVTIDFDQNDMLHRADLCPACGEVVFEMLRPLMVHMRAIADRDSRGLRTYKYKAVDAQSGQIFSVASIIDDGA